MNKQDYTELLANLAGSACTYHFDVPFSITHQEDGIFVLGDTLTVNLTPDGLTYLMSKAGDIDKKQVREWLRAGEFDKVAHELTLCRSILESQNTKEQGKTFIAAVKGGSLYGWMTHYVPVSDYEVLTALEPLQDHISHVVRSIKEFTLYLHSDFAVKKNGQNVFSWGVAVRNGETGHVALSYSLYIDADGYTILLPLALRRKHLSNVSDLIESLPDVQDVVRNIELDEKLKRLKVEDIEFNTRAGRQLADILADYAHQSALELVVVLLAKQDEKGTKTAVKQALDTLFRTAGEL